MIEGVTGTDLTGNHSVDEQNEANERVDLHGDNLEQHQHQMMHPFDHPVDPVGRRTRQPPAWLRDYDRGEGCNVVYNQDEFCLFIDADPITYEEAAQSAKWRCAMETEIQQSKEIKRAISLNFHEGQQQLG